MFLFPWINFPECLYHHLLEQDSWLCAIFWLSLATVCELSVPGLLRRSRAEIWKTRSLICRWTTSVGFCIDATMRRKMTERDSVSTICRILARCYTVDFKVNFYKFSVIKFLIWFSSYQIIFLFSWEGWWYHATIVSSSLSYPRCPNHLNLPCLTTAALYSEVCNSSLNLLSFNDIPHVHRTTVHYITLHYFTTPLTPQVTSGALTKSYSSIIGELKQVSFQLYALSSPNYADFQPSLSNVYVSVPYVDTHCIQFL